MQTQIRLLLKKQCRPRSDCFWRSNLISVFPVCYFGVHFVNSGIESQHFIWELKMKRFWNFRTFTWSAENAQTCTDVHDWSWSSVIKLTVRLEPFFAHPLLLLWLCVNPYYYCRKWQIFCNTLTPVLSSHSKINKTEVLMTDGSLY